MGSQVPEQGPLLAQPGICCTRGVVKMEAAEVSGPPVGGVTGALNQRWSRGLLITSVWCQ